MRGWGTIPRALRVYKSRGRYPLLPPDLLLTCSCTHGGCYPHARCLSLRLLHRRRRQIIVPSGCGGAQHRRTILSRASFSQFKHSTCRANGETHSGKEGFFGRTIGKCKWQQEGKDVRLHQQQQRSRHALLVEDMHYRDSSSDQDMHYSCC